MEISAFGESLSVSPKPAVQVSFAYNIHADIVSTQTANGGTITQSDGSAVLSTSANIAGSAILESKDVVRYGPGQGVIARFAASFAPPRDNSTQLAGIGNTSDGFFFGYNGTQFGALRRRNNADEWTPIENSPDDPTLGNVYQIRFQWLGHGKISFYVESSGTGFFTEVASIPYAGTQTTPSILNPTLPLRLEVTNFGNASDLVLRASSLGAYNEGPSYSNFIRRSFSFTNGSIAATETPIFTIRNRSTFESKTNRTIITPDFLTVDVAEQGTAGYRFRYIVNDSLDGTEVFGNLDTNRSVVETDTTASALNGDGIELLSLLSEGGQSVIVPLSELSLRTRPGESVTITAQRISGATTPVVAASLSWQECY